MGENKLPLIGLVRKNFQVFVVITTQNSRENHLSKNIISETHFLFENNILNIYNIFWQ